MSLINDALRKARKAASERDAEKPAVPFRGARVRPPRRSRDGAGAALVILIALAAATLGAGAVWWLLDRGDTSPVARHETVTPAATLVENPATGEPEQPDQGASTPSVPSGSPEDSFEAGGSPPVRHPVAEMTEPEADPAAAREQQATPRPTGPDVTELGDAAEVPGESEDERVYVLDADLGYAALSLDYIVSRPDDPFAEINGIEVHLGSEVAGFVVEAIEADHVLLRDDRGPLTLRVP